MKFRMMWLRERSETLRILITGLRNILSSKRGDKMEPQERAALRCEIEDYEEERRRRNLECGVMLRNPELQY
jgi:hypothetical protein